MVARNGHHTYMPKPTGYGTRPHPLTFHIHNRITLLVPYTYTLLTEYVSTFFTYFLTSNTDTSSNSA